MNGSLMISSTQNASETETLAAEVQPSSEQQPKTDGGGHASKWAVLSLVAVGVFMATLDSSIVNISLPAIARAFGVPLSGATEWVIIAYLVVVAGALLTIGRLADMLGRKPIWAAGLALFTLGSAFCGGAPSLGLLITARALQGFGGAFILAISPAMLTSAFASHERGRALGLNAVVVALGVSTGPTLGGLLTTSLSWRWIFLVNVPLGIIGFIATLLVLDSPARRERVHFDLLGALLLAIGLIAITLGLSFGQEWGWSSPRLIGVLMGGVVALVALYLVEKRVAHPMLILSLLRNRVFLSANLSLCLSFLALFAVSFLLPFYFEELRHFPVIEAGLLLTPLPLTIAVFAPLSGALSDPIRTPWLAASGLTLACIGLVLISQLNAQSTLFAIVWRLVVIGLGQALFQSPNNSALMGAAPKDQQGSASGFLATGRVVGQSVSVALAGDLLTSLGGALAGSMLVALPHVPVAQLSRLQQTFVSSFHATFLACAAIAALGIATSLVRGKERG